MQKSLPHPFPPLCHLFILALSCCIAAHTSARTVRIHIVGEVVRPGTYALSPRAPLSQALRTAGGITPYGSVRHIRLLRGDSVIDRPDLYRQRFDSLPLRTPEWHHGDVLIIGTYEARVSLSGSVRRPGTYDILPHETLSRLLHFAGGLTEKGKHTIVKRLRTQDGFRTLSDLSPSACDTALLHDGDVIHVDSRATRRARLVSVSGAVKRPGFYEWNESTTLHQALNQAGGPTEEADLRHVIITRRGDRHEPRRLAANLQHEDTDTLLRAEDAVYVPRRDGAWTRRTVSIGSGVFRPGNYAYAQGMTAADLLALAGGLRPEAQASRFALSRRLEEAQREHPSDTLAQYFILPLADTLLSTLQLHPYDDLQFLADRHLRPSGRCYVAGAVKFGGFHAWHQGLTAAGAVRAAGGLTPEACNHPAVLRGGKVIGLDNAASPFLLADGDTLLIPSTPRIVSLIGAVQQPGTLISHKAGAHRSYYIGMAGGLCEDADPSRAYGISVNGRAFRLRRHTPIPPGTTIVVPAAHSSAADEELSEEEIGQAVRFMILYTTRLILK